ncbi:MAG: rod shape-determining protein MreC [Patescibacteria group bacterium]
MSYLQDKKTKNKKTWVAVGAFLFLVIIFYFRSSVFGGLSYVSNAIFHPVIVMGNNTGSKFSNIFSFFTSKNSLINENNTLKQELGEKDATMANYNALLDENNQLKDVLGRKKEQANLVLAAILAKPNQSPYDTLVIDAGKNQNLSVGNLVLALGNVPIGRVSEVDATTSKVVLFSNPGEKTEIVIEGRSVFMSIVGRGGGNFEMVVPRDFSIDKGANVVLPGISPNVVGTVSTIITDPRDAFTKALLVSPVNIFELKFVEVQR